MSKAPDLSPRTLAAQALGRIDETSRALVPPIHISSTFIRDPDNLYRSGNSYGRPDNDTVREAEAVIAALEGATDDNPFRLGNVGGDRAVPVLGRGRARRRAAGDVLWRTRLARQRSTRLRD